MLRAVAYARFSSELQREESIDAQLRAIRKYCTEHDAVLLTVYADKGISGTSDNRPEFQRMIADADKGEFDAVIVHKLDRFARNRYDSAIYKNHLKKRGIRLISVLENLQDTPESVILESVLEGINEYYSLNLSREVRKGLLENALACKATGGPPPLGYSVDKETHRYVINEYEAEAIRMIFRMYLDGSSYTEIIAELNRRGYRTRRGDLFGKNSLYALLRNERYTGVYIYIADSAKHAKGRYDRSGNYDENAVIRVPGGMPAIISEEDFHRVQEKMAERRHKSAQFSAKQEYLLSGKITCGVCGNPYAGNSRSPARAIRCTCPTNAPDGIRRSRPARIPRSTATCWRRWCWSGYALPCSIPESFPPCWSGTTATWPRNRTARGIPPRHCGQSFSRWSARSKTP